MENFDFQNPLNYKNLEKNSDFIVVSMFTENYRHLAIRLKKSLDNFDINYIVINTPSVHKSISPKGSNDLSFTKSNLIAQSLSIFNKPVLYLDCDTVIESYPILIDELVSKNIDFSIFNWLSGEDNCAYVPCEINGLISEFYIFSHSIEYRSEHQLICSGAVQFWNTSLISKKILNDWQNAIATYHLAQDDHCLDFAFNNLEENFKSSMKFLNLPKSYSRYAWWIFDQPVINHPQIPFSGNYFKEITTNDGRLRCYLKNASEKKSIKIIQEDEIWNSDNQILYKNVNGELIPSRIITEKVWV